MAYNRSFRRYASQATALENDALKTASVQEYVDGLEVGDVVYSHGVAIEIQAKYPFIAKTNYGYMPWIDIYQFEQGLLPSISGSYYYETIKSKKAALEYLTRFNRVVL